MNTMAQIEHLIVTGAAHSVFVGKSVAPGKSRFATIRNGQGETVATGSGATAEEALNDALSRCVRPVALETRPVIPGMTRIPGL